MLKLLSYLLVSVAAVWTFDLRDFQRKYCYDGTSLGIVLGKFSFPERAGNDHNQSTQNGYLCENFVLTKTDLDDMTKDSTVLSSHPYIFLRNCTIDYFNENFVATFPDMDRLFMDNCQLSLKESDVTTTTTSFVGFYHIGFHNCDIRDNLNSKALQKFNGLTTILFRNSTLQYPQIDKYLMPRRVHGYPIRILMDNINGVCIQRDWFGFVPRSMIRSLDGSKLTYCQTDTSANSSSTVQTKT